MWVGRIACCVSTCFSSLHLCGRCTRRRSIDIVAVTKASAPRRRTYRPRSRDPPVELPSRGKIIPYYMYDVNDIHDFPRHHPLGWKSRALPSKTVYLLLEYRSRNICLPRRSAVFDHYNMANQKSPSQVLRNADLFFARPLAWKIPLVPHSTKKCAHPHEPRSNQAIEKKMCNSSYPSVLV